MLRACEQPGNQEQRVEQLVADFEGILRDGVLHFGCARRLRGRLLFARSVCYGRFGAAALKTVNDAITAASGTARDAQLDMQDELRMALANLKSAIGEKVVHMIPVRFVTPVHVFTDGACEPSPTGELEGTIGGVLLDVPSGKYEYFMATIRPDVMQRLQHLSANPICQVELLAVLASLCLWRFPLLIGLPLFGWTMKPPGRP